MPLTIHDRAKIRFDELAEAVLSMVKPVEAVRPVAPRPPAKPDERPMRVIAAEDIKVDSLVVSLVGIDGRRAGLQFMAEGKPYRLDGDGITYFEDLLEHLGRQRQLYQAVGPEFLSSNLREWLKAHLCKQTSSTFSEWFLERANASVQPRTIVIPLENFRPESAFDFGGVRFDPVAITKAMFDHVEAEWIAAQPDQETDIRHAHERYRRWFQGQTCGVVSLSAESRWAAHSAAEVLDRALWVLRLFSPSAFISEFKCAVGRVGRVFVPADVTCELIDGRPASISDGVAPGFERVQWPLSDQDRAVNMAAGMADLERLLLKDSLSELEEAVLQAVRLLDESVCCNAPHKRAALALTAAESLFLQNDSEPIQVMLGLRCGRLVGRTVPERIDIDGAIKSAYELRSAYLHHGRTKVDPAVLRRLHEILLDAVVAVSRLSQSLRSRAEMFAHLQSLVWG